MFRKLKVCFSLSNPGVSVPFILSHNYVSVCLFIFLLCCCGICKVFAVIVDFCLHIIVYFHAT